MNSQKRYTDDELLYLLKLLSTDLVKKPTHREILNDVRLPTHHTYINRFESIDEALKKADIYNMEDRSEWLNLIEEILVGIYGAENVYRDFFFDESMSFHFMIIHGENKRFIDFVGYKWSDDKNHEDTAEDLKEMRLVIAERLGISENYVQVTGRDIYKLYKL